MATDMPPVAGRDIHECFLFNDHSLLPSGGIILALIDYEYEECFERKRGKCCILCKYYAMQGTVT